MYEILKDDPKYRLFKADSGAAALEVIRDQDIHIALVDVVMPVMDGYELCRRIRRERRGSPIQIVLISGFEEKSDLEALLDLGADDFIGKPVTPLELYARMNAAVIRHRNQTENHGSLRGYGAREGELSSLMAENLFLRREVEKIRRLNQELERSNEELERLASFDPLSGLLNRRTLFKRVEMEIERSLRLQLPLTGMMMDIDHFKRINDEYGHLCGDVALKEIGRRLNSSLRKYDYAGRYGGEEFFVLFSNTTADTTRTIAERFRLDIEGTPYSCSGQVFRVTVSVGIAQYHPGEAADRWIERADNAMYRAKQHGRNQVVVS